MLAVAVEEVTPRVVQVHQVQAVQAVVRQVLILEMQ